MAAITIGKRTVDAAGPGRWYDDRLAGFGLYVSNFGNYNATYGSLGAVVVFLTWLYLTAYILLIGGELNSELEKKAKGDTSHS